MTDDWYATRGLLKPQAKGLDRPELREKAPILKSYIVPDRTPWFDGHVEFPTLEQQRNADHEHYKALIPDEEVGFAKGIEHYRKVILPVMVEEAKREERERRAEELSRCFELAPNDDSYLRILVKSLLEYLKTGKRAVERQALKGE